MHPERSSRVVLDGVLEPEDYYAGTRLKNLHDLDKIITKFCEYCHEAGPEKCPLYTPRQGPEVVGYSDMVL